MYVEKKHVNDIWHMTWLKRKYNSFFSQFLKLTNSFISFIWFFFWPTTCHIWFMYDKYIFGMYSNSMNFKCCVWYIKSANVSITYIYSWCFFFVWNKWINGNDCFFLCICLFHIYLFSTGRNILLSLSNPDGLLWFVWLKRFFLSVSESGKRSEWQLFSDCVTTTNYGHGDFNFNFQFKSVNCSLVVFFTDSIQQQRRTNTSKKKSKKTKHWLSVSINDVDDDVWFLQLD